MKKKLSVVLSLVMVITCIFAFTGCTNSSEDLKYDIVMITDGGTVNDSSYNQSAWTGIEQAVEEANKDVAEGEEITCRYYQPKVEEGETLSTETAIQYIDLAVQKGAKYIVLPTDVFEVAVYETSREYSDVNFILIDGVPHPEGSDIDAYIQNVMCISFDTLQSGFLAGYNAVISGNTKLGYFGSVNSDTSSSYGAGYVQGAAYAADQLGIPVTLDYADYDSPLLDYDYSFTVTAVYDKIENIDKDCFVVKVENGTGSGTYKEGENVTVTADPAPEGKVFDHWEFKSDTEGVKDKKVNLSTTKEPVTNLLVEKCSCTITAVYADAEATTYPVTVMQADGETVYSTQYVTAENSCEVKAPVAEEGMVFSHWEISTQEEGAIDDINAKDTWVHVTESTQGITLVPVYEVSETPTFSVTVVTGEGGNGESYGSGNYVTGDTVELAAAVPQEGYIFSHWSNADSDGYSTGITMENEFYPYTTFTMVNRYQAVVEKMYDSGVSIVYAGGNDQCNAVSDATWNYNYQKLAIGAENWQASWDNYYSTTIKDYGVAVKACLENFQGGYVYTGNCSNEAIYMNNVDEEVKASYDEVYKALANGSIKITGVAPGADVRQAFSSNCLTLNYWIV